MMKHLFFVSVIILNISGFQYARAQKTDQTITFSSIPAKIFGDPSFDLTASASSGLPIVFTSSNTSIATVVGSTVTIVGAGQCTITASQAGNNSFNAAISVTRQFVVSKAAHVILFSSMPVKTYKDPPFVPPFSSSAGLPITLTSADPTVATISNGQIVINNAGSVEITASQLGNQNYLPAVSITRTLVIQKLSQSIGITGPVTATFGDSPISYAAVSTSGLLVDQWTSQYDTVATVSGSTVTIVGAGTTKISAIQSGNKNYLPAHAEKLLTINKATQQITLNTLPPAHLGDPPVEIIASVNTGLPLVFTSSRPKVVAIAGTAAVIGAVGTSTITVTQSGNANYLPVSSSQTINVTTPERLFMLAGSAQTGGNGKGTLYNIKTDGSSFNKTYTFPASANVMPNGGFITGSDGRLYGVLPNAGNPANGVVFSLAADGTGFTVLHNFVNTDGSSPKGSLIEASNGYLYGTTMYGQSFTGNIYRVKKDGTGFSVIHNFSTSYWATGSLLQAVDGKLYGATMQGGGVGYGALFSINLDGTGYSEFVSFNGTLGSTPMGGLVQGPDQYLYGVTSGGGSLSKGVLYKVKTDGTNFTLLVEFTGESNGSYGSSSLIIGSDGLLYGMTKNGGTNDMGTIFSIHTDGSGYDKLLDFDGNNGALPQGSLVESATDGYLYGMTYQGGASGLGVVFKIKKDGTNYTRLLDFDGIKGANPMLGPLLEFQTGNFIGMTYIGGPSYAGTIFTISSTGSYHLVKDFPQPAGSPMVLVSNPGNTALYGVASSGGAFGNGAIFKAQPDGSNYSVITDIPGTYVFCKRLFYMSDDTLWGIGQEGVVTYTYFIFKVNADGTGFQRIADTSTNPALQGEPTSLLDYSTGYIYGVTQDGGANNAGTLFSVKKDGSALTKLADFPGGTSSARPYINIIRHSNGAIYGASQNGGAYDNGTIFRIDFNNIITNIFELNPTVGYGARAIIELNDGDLCVITFSGKMFSVDENGNNFRLINTVTFSDNNLNSMVQAIDGSIYVAGSGNLYKIKPDGTSTTLFFFDNTTGTTLNSILFSKLPQTINSFDPIPAKKVSDVPFVLNATTSSGTKVIFKSSDESIATVDGYLVTLHGVGTVTITGKIPASSNYVESPPVQQTFTVAPGNQQLIFNTIPPITYGSPPIRLQAYATSGLAVTFSSSDPGVATINKNMLTIVGAGTVTITATVASSPNYVSVGAAQQILTVQKANQVITFDPLPVKFTDSPPYTLSAINSLAQPVIFSSSNSNVAVTNANSITIAGEGQATITASSPGNSNVLAAQPVDQLFRVIKHDQQIVLDPVPDQPNGITTVELITPPTTSGLPVSISVESSHASLNGNILTLNSAGKVTVRANQSGNANYYAAQEQSITFCILPPKPTLTSSIVSPAAVTLTSGVATGNLWYRNGNLLSGFTTQSINVSESGNYTVVVSVEGCLSAPSNPEQVSITGLPDTQAQFKIYPNPASKSITLSIESTKSKTMVEIDIVDMLGRVLYHTSSSSSSLEIDISSLPAGFYALRAQSDEGVRTAKFVKR